MFTHDSFFGYSPLYLAQAAFTIWMLIDANRRGVESIWFWIIFLFQPLGPWAYFFTHKIGDFTRSGFSTSWFSNLFTRRPSLEELRYRANQSPTVMGRLELAHRLFEIHEYEEAMPHLKAVLAHEPDLGSALYALAVCHRENGQPGEAVPLLQKMLKQRANWKDYMAWHTLIDTHQKAGQLQEAADEARKLDQAAPSLEHKCLLAHCLDNAGDKAGARLVLEKGLEEYRFTPNPTRQDRRWVGKTKRLLKDLG